MEFANIGVVVGDLSPLVVLGTVDVECFAHGLGVEEQFPYHLSGISSPAQSRRYILCLNGQNHLFACSGSADGVGGFESHQLVTQIAVCGRRTHDSPVFGRHIAEDIFSPCLAYAVVIRVDKQIILRRVDESRRALFHRHFKVVVNSAAREKNILSGTGKHHRQDNGQLLRGVYHKVNDRIVVAAEQLVAERRVFGISGDVSDIGIAALDGNSVKPIDLAAAFGKVGNHITCHSTVCTDDQNFFVFHKILRSFVVFNLRFNI